MAQGQLGFFPLLIPLITTAASALYGKKEAKKQQQAAETMQTRQAEIDAINSGGAYAASQIITARDAVFLRGVWAAARQAPQWYSVNWSKMPGGVPQVTPQTAAAMAYLWPRVRGSASYDAVNWGEIAVPKHLVAAAMPLPEAPATASYYETPQQSYARTASIIPGVSWPVVAAVGAGAVGLILLMQRR